MRQPTTSPMTHPTRARRWVGMLLLLAFVAMSVTSNTAGAASADIEGEGLSTSGPVSLGSDTTASGGGFISFDQSSAPAIPAFPGAEGFGASTRGGRGGVVMEVTNLNDSGTGSLRACAEARVARICVFRVSGIIETAKAISIKYPYITIAGQTAPGGGITLKSAPAYYKGSLVIRTHDVVVRYLRVRPGPSTAISGDRRGVSIEGQAYNVVLDHLSVSWGTDSNINVTDGARNLTIQWSIISEALANSTHPDGEHSKGLHISGKQYTGTAPTEDISVHHNVLAYNADRNPRNASRGKLDFVNNVVYDWGKQAVELNDNWGKLPNNIVANVFIAGVDTKSFEVDFDPQGTGFGTEVFVEGNIGPNRPNDLLPQSDVVRPSARGSVVPHRFDAPLVTTTSAAAAYDAVLASAGARALFPDPVDDRVVANVRAGTGRIIDSPDQVGGWPTPASATAPVDSDRDGMPNTWESARGLDPTRNDSALDRQGDGYTNVEEYINGLAGDDAAASLTPCPAGSQVGTASGTINADVGARYFIWSRLRAPVVSGSYWLQIDGVCHKIGSAALTPNAWTWINRESGKPDVPFSVYLQAGQHDVKLIAADAQVRLDRVLATPDGSCVPDGTSGCPAPTASTSTSTTTTAPTTTTGAQSVTTVEVRVNASIDDVEESTTGSMSISSSDLEFVTEDTVQTVGIRFAAVPVPRGASITRAWVQFTADEKSSTTTALTIRGQAADSAAAFTKSRANISSRARTGASASWSPAAWTTVGQASLAQRTTDLSAVVREITDRSGWSSGNAMVVIVTGSGKRTAEAFDGLPNGAPLLHIEYM